MDFESDMTITWTITDAAQLASPTTARQWDALNAECQNLPFLETLFLLPLLKEFGTAEYCLCLGRNTDCLVAAVVVTRNGLGRWISAQPSQLPLGAVLIKTGVPVADVCASLLCALPEFKLSLAFTQLDPAAIARPSASPCLSTLDYIDTAWVDINGEFADYWAARGKNLRQNLRKQRSKLAAEGKTLSLQELRLPGQMKQALLDYGQLEASSWKSELGTSIEPGNAQGRFYLSMLEGFAAAGRAVVYRYTLDDKVVAMDLCIESAGTLVILKTSYDSTEKSISPAFLMREEQFQRLFESRHLTRIEFFGRIMEWHTRWTDNSRTLFHCNAYRNAWVPKMLALRTRLKRVDAPSASVVQA